MVWREAVRHEVRWRARSQLDLRIVELDLAARRRRLVDAEAEELRLQEGLPVQQGCPLALTLDSEYGVPQVGDVPVHGEEVRVHDVRHPEGADLVYLLLALDLPEHDLVVLAVHHHGAPRAVHLDPVLECGLDARRGVHGGGGATRERDDGGADVLNLDVVVCRPRLGEDALHVAHERVHEVEDVRGLRRQAPSTRQLSATGPPMIARISVVAGVTKLLV
mmetsp:Transcript_20902/g.65326  ORF Transcript_20902/g.65326 Transcript_20902/m.65326 type:complete len:220 (-) Transcript_20902:536-1195(-)